MKREKILIFIDGSNLYHDLIKNFNHASLDFVKFTESLAGKNKLGAVYYYSAPLMQKDNPEAYKKQQKFFSSLEKMPKIEVKLGRLEKRPNGPPVEKGVDVRMAVDIVTHAYSNIYDTAIIVSGDSDFVPAIKAAQDFGKKIINISFPKTKSFHLNQVCDKTIIIENNEFEKLTWSRE
ncbi:MAG: NYN domain-containing protein [archaeon]|nr:NYN domain-containing protein [archaeon]